MLQVELEKARALLATHHPEELSSAGRAHYEAASAHAAAENRRMGEIATTDSARGMRFLGESVEYGRRAQEAQLEAERREKEEHEAAERRSMVTLVHRDGYIREFLPGVAARILGEPGTLWTRQPVLKAAEPERPDVFMYPDMPVAEAPPIDLDQRAKDRATHRRATKRGTL